MIQIKDPHDPRIEGYSSIKERDLVGRKALFVAEGEVVLRVLLRSQLMEIVSVLIADSRSDVFGGLIGKFPIYIASQEVMDNIVGFHIHRGVLALGRRRSILSVDELLGMLPGSCTVVVLHGIANHDNMGGIFRNAAAFGADAVIADATSCDPLYRKAIRVSVGGVFEVPFAKLGEDDDLIDILKRHNIEALALSPAGTTTLCNLRASSRKGVIFGAEGPGLPDHLMKRCKTVRISLSRNFDSLNVATTSGIVLHHLFEVSVAAPSRGLLNHKRA